MKFLSFAVMLILILSCGKAPSIPESYEEKRAEPLAGKSDNEILRLKYNHLVYLDCALYVQGKQVDQFQWDVVREGSLLRVLNYKLGDRDTIVGVKVKHQLTFLDSHTHINELKNEYYMEHSPVLHVSFRRAANSILRDGSIHDRQSFSERALYENIETSLFTLVTDDKDYGHITEELRCELKTVMGPLYRHQWKRVK
jgi:hypothetical protein